MSRFIPQIEKRYSPYNFSDKGIDKSVVANILEASTQAPSSYNDQPWRYIVGFKGDEVYNKILNTLAEPNQKWAQTVPVLVLGIAATTSDATGKENYYSLYDLGQATAFMILQAAEHNVYAHQMGGFSKEAAVKSFNVSEEYTPGAVIALGYRGDENETKERARKPLSDIVFSEALELNKSSFATESTI